MLLHNLYHFECESNRKSDICFVFVHGFASDAGEWQEICYSVAPEFSCYALSLPGCVRSDYPDEFTPDAESLGLLLEAFVNHLPYKKIILCGYSMGARICLYTTLRCSPKISGLILESGTPGIRDPQEREKRMADDNAFADTISSLSGEAFEKLWKSREIFSSQTKLPPEAAAQMRQRRRRSQPAFLAEYLRHFGTGVMPVLWNDLHRLSVPVLLISGKLDQKFSRIAQEMNEAFPRSVHQSIPGAGHNTHLEKPADFVNLLLRFSTIV